MKWSSLSDCEISALAGSLLLGVWLVEVLYWPTGPDNWQSQCWRHLVYPICLLGDQGAPACTVDMHSSLCRVCFRNMVLWSDNSPNSFQEVYFTSDRQLDQRYHFEILQVEYVPGWHLIRRFCFEENLLTAKSSVCSRTFSWSSYDRCFVWSWGFSLTRIKIWAKTYSNLDIQSDKDSVRSSAWRIWCCIGKAKS